MKRVIIIGILLLVVGVGLYAMNGAIIPFLQKVTVQIIVKAEYHTCNYNWYRAQYEGTPPKDADLKWHYTTGEWKSQMVTIMGSGVVVFSGQWDKDTYKTFILTNWHVVSLLIDEKARGSMWKPFLLYSKQDKIVSYNPPSIKIRENSRPIGEGYYTIPINYVSVKHRKNQHYRVNAKIALADKALDVAVLELDNVWGLPYATLSATPAYVGEKIWVSGAPLGIPFSVDQGHVNQVHLDLGSGLDIVWDNQIKYDCPTAPGNSGSGLYNEYGDLVGLVHGGLVYAGNFIEGSNLAIDAEDIKDFLIWNGFAKIVFQKRYANK